MVLQLNVRRFDEALASALAANQACLPDAPELVIYNKICHLALTQVR